MNQNTTITAVLSPNFTRTMGNPLIHSFAHGKQIYRFQPMRLEYHFEAEHPPENIKHISTEQKPIDPIWAAKLQQESLNFMEPAFRFGNPLTETYHFLVGTINEAIMRGINGLPPEVLLFPAPTGAGKSTLAQLIMALLPHVNSGYSVLLVMEQKKDLVDAIRRVRDLGGEDIAACSYYLPESEKRPDEYCDMKDLHKYPIGAITHEMFRRKSYISDKDSPQLKEVRDYGGKKRNCIIIDETISFRQTIEFTTSRLRLAHGTYDLMPDSPILDDIIWKLTNFKMPTGESVASYYDPEMVKKLELFQDKLWETNNNIHPHYRANTIKADRNRRKLEELLVDMLRVLRDKNNLVTPEKR